MGREGAREGRTAGFPSPSGGKLDREDGGIRPPGRGVALVGRGLALHRPEGLGGPFAGQDAGGPGAVGTAWRSGWYQGLGGCITTPGKASPPHRLAAAPPSRLPHWSMWQPHLPSLRSGCLLPQHPYNTANVAIPPTRCWNPSRDRTVGSLAQTDGPLKPKFLESWVSPSGCKASHVSGDPADRETPPRFPEHVSSERLVSRPRWPRGRGSLGSTWAGKLLGTGATGPHDGRSQATGRRANAAASDVCATCPGLGQGPAEHTRPRLLADDG